MFTLTARVLDAFGYSFEAMNIERFPHLRDDHEEDDYRLNRDADLRDIGFDGQPLHLMER